MINRLPIFLLDLDGVLIEPRGYRLAIQSTLKWFTNRMGLGDLYPGEDAIAGFEAISMTNEWDIIAILLAAIFDRLVNENPSLCLPRDLLEACDVVHDQNLDPPKINLVNIKGTLSENFKPGLQYADLAFELSRLGDGCQLFKAMASHPLLENILTRTRMLDGSLTTRVFQHFTLGSHKFEEFTGIKAFFDSESFLLKHDRVLLKEETRESFLQVWRQAKCGAVIFTARPSLPQTGRAFTYNYSPEAEIAMQALQLSELLLIGGGKMGWLASRLGFPIEQLTKPSPVQALAAIGTAVTRQSELSLQAAADFWFKGVADFYNNLPPLSIHVFEDSGGNIKSVQHAVEQLNVAGIDIHFKAWGISENPQKQQALREAGAVLVPDINQALQNAFHDEKL